MIEEDATGWKQKGLALVGAAVVVLFTAAAGLYTILSTMAAPLHENAADVPSVRRSEPSAEWKALAEQGRTVARAGLIEWNLPGLSVAVGVDNEIVWAEAFGWADLEKRVPLAPHMRFRIGHASKALTSAGVGLLLERGQLDLDEEIHTYVPAFPRKQWPVTLRQLMGHVAGIRHYREEADYMPTTHCQRAVDGVPAFADDPLRFQPESQYGYSTFGWVLVSAAVEAAAKEPFFSFMRTHIFEPLGMRETTTDSIATSIPDLATFYYPRFSGDNAYGPEPATPVDYSCFAGAGAFLSTPSDLVRFGLALDGGSLLQPATVTLLQTPQSLLTGADTPYGLGWMLETVPIAGEPTRLVHHASRTMLGGSAWFTILPGRGLVVAVMSNTSHAAVREIALKLVATFNPAQRPVHP